MLHFYTQIISGTIKPHLIEFSNIEKVQKEFFAQTGSSILSEESLKLCAKKYGAYNIIIDEELKNIVFNTIPEEHLEELFDIRFPPAPDKKALTYKALIELEYERIKLQTDNYIEDSIRLDELEFWVKKNIQKLKTLSKQLAEYIKRLEGEHGNFFIIDSNHFISYVLKHYLIDTIQYIQENTSSLINIEFETTDKLLLFLFDEAPAKLPLAILSLLPKKKTYNTFKQNFIESNKASLLDPNFYKKGLSIGKALFDFYKAKNKKLDKDTQLNNYHQYTNYWCKLLITGELEIIEFGKKTNEPEIEKVLLPLLKKEIELLQAVTTQNKSIEADSNSDFDPESETKKIVHPYKDTMNINDLVEYTGISKSTIHKYTSAGTIPFYKKGKFLYFSRVEIEEWLQEKRGFNLDDIENNALTSLTIKRK
ncbi:helix-turn-helix domain-containing protein [Marinifilum flexuosum]|uniref:helix-turn-helix domain-containing protein n=1 Tax=Marinifilum flexuosum TaxID=1117708 RepID=UPI0024914BA0|nr:helix-turn-helix domain-containing protein [Marinifilum flexuosum]